MICKGHDSPPSIVLRPAPCTFCNRITGRFLIYQLPGPRRKRKQRTFICFGFLNFRSIKVNIKENLVQVPVQVDVSMHFSRSRRDTYSGLPYSGQIRCQRILIGNIEANSNVGYEVGSVIKRPPPPFVHHCTSSSCLSTLKISVQAGSTIHSLPGACRLKRAVSTADRRILFGCLN